MLFNQFSLFIVKISNFYLLLYGFGQILLFGLMLIVFYLDFQIMDEFGAYFLSIQDRIWSPFASCIYTLSPYQPQDLLFYPWTAICNYFLPFKHRYTSMVRAYLTWFALARTLLVNFGTHAAYCQVVGAFVVIFHTKMSLILYLLLNYPWL